MKLENNISADNYSEAVKEAVIPSQRDDSGAISMTASPVFLLDVTKNPVKPQYYAPYGSGNPILVSAIADAAITAAGKTITVPAGKIWQVQQWTCDVTCSATVGNRVLRVAITAVGSYTRWIGQNSANVTANQIANYDILFGCGGAPNTSTRRNMADTAQTNIGVRETCGALFLQAGDTINIKDTAGIDNADVVRALISIAQYDA